MKVSGVRGTGRRAKTTFDRDVQAWLEDTVVAEARRQGMGVVGMKALAAGRLLEAAAPEELLRYTATIADTVIVGCSSLAEVRQNLGVAETFTPMSAEEQRALEARVAPRARTYDYFKAGVWQHG